LNDAVHDDGYRARNKPGAHKCAPYIAPRRGVINDARVDSRTAIE